jgi:hypothetical protein
MTGVPAPDRAKLTKLLSLLGSDHPGEPDNAAGWSCMFAFRSPVRSTEVVYVQK